MRQLPSSAFPIATRIAIFAAIGAVVWAHSDDPGDNSPGFFEPIAYGLPDSRVTIREEGEKRIVESNAIPNHETGRFPNPGQCELAASSTAGGIIDCTRISSNREPSKRSASFDSAIYCARTRS